MNKLHNQQDCLDSMILELEHKCEAIDIFCENIMKDHYSKYISVKFREIQSILWKFTMLVLGCYLNRKEIDIPIISKYYPH